MAEQLSAQLAMVLDKISELAHRLEACIFGEVRPFEAFIIVDRPLFRMWDW